MERLLIISDYTGRPICAETSTVQFNVEFKPRTIYCSLEPNHEGNHKAFICHNLSNAQPLKEWE